MLNILQWSVKLQLPMSDILLIPARLGKKKKKTMAGSTFLASIPCSLSKPVSRAPPSTSVHNVMV